MMIARFGPAAVIGLFLVIAPSAHSAEKSCIELDSRIAAAGRSGDVELARELYSVAESDTRCSGEGLLVMGRNAAYAHYNRAYAGSISQMESEQLLRSALKFGRPWQVLASVGDLEKTARHYVDATALYQEALDDIRDEKLNPTAPPVAVVASIYKKAEETRLLADHYVPRVDRSGRPGGLALHRFRGFEVQRSAVPVQFKFDSDDFTDDGRRAVADMAAYLADEGSPDIVLIGHTDPRGAAVYNKALSERRAEAVKTFLLARSYTGRIQTIGRGELEPFEPDDPGSYTQDEIWQLDRRVELER